MGKGLESFGLIDGFDIIKIGKLKANKEEIFAEIVKYDNNIIKNVQELVNNNSGMVFAIVKKKRIYGLYLFEREKKDDVYNLKNIKTVYSDEVSNNTREKYNEHVLNIAKDYVSYQQFEKVTLNDNVVQLNSKKNKKERILALLSGFLVGFTIGWIIFDEIYMGICFGIVMAPTFSGLDVVVQKKRGRKKK